MTDTVTKKERSEIMRAIKSKDSTIEQQVRKELSKLGIRYRKNVSYLKGKPDVVLNNAKKLIFIDSCFWHGCKKHGKIPKVRKKYWEEKIKANKKRDRQINLYYKNSNWKVVRIWEHEIKKDLDKTIKKILTK
jgi:DNA mismatch endonuclease (patch repair protein)